MTAPVVYDLGALVVAGLLGGVVGVVLGGVAALWWLARTGAPHTPPPPAPPL